MSGSFDQTKAEICTFVCERYLETGQGTGRKSINLRFRKPDLLSEMAYSDNLFEQSTSGDLFLPKLRAFVVASDPRPLETVSRRLIVIIHVMKGLYLSDETNTSSMYPWQRFLTESRELDPSVDEASLRSGFLLAGSLGITGGYQHRGDGNFQAVGVSDRILTVDDPKSWLEARFEELRPKPSTATADPPEIDPKGFEVAEPFTVFFRDSGTAAPARTEMPFVSNPDLRRIVERDYAELSALDPEATPKSVLIMAGAIIEGLLLDALMLTGKRDFTNFEVACGRFLSDMIAPAKAEGIIKEDRLTDAIRKYRALAHPAREIRDGVSFTVHDARLAKSAVEVILREVSKWHDQRHARLADL